MPAETGHTVSLMPRSVTRVGRNLQEVKNASGADSTADQNLYRCGRGIRTQWASVSVLFASSNA